MPEGSHEQIPSVTFIVSESSEAARERAAQARLMGHEWSEVDHAARLKQLDAGDVVLFSGRWFLRQDAQQIESALKIAANRS
jgi:uncharacterized protein YciI